MRCVYVDKWNSRPQKHYKKLTLNGVDENMQNPGWNF